MDLSLSALYAPKEGSAVADYEDAFAFSAESSVAAVADGAGEAFESRKWARLLTEAFIEWPPFGLTEDEMLDWVDQVSARWTALIPWRTLDYFEGERAAEGSAATLIGLSLEEMLPGNRQWRCLAIGDSCMFRVSAEQCAESVPITSSTAFTARPPLLYTRRETAERYIGKLVAREGTWQPGDRFFLLTDAMSEWFLREAEHGGQPWETLTSLDQQSFGAFVAHGREHGLIRNDDVTAVMLEPQTLGVPEISGVDAASPAGRREPVLIGGARPRTDPPGTGTDRPPQEPPHTAPSAGRRTAILVGVLLFGLLAGILIGRATGGSSAPPGPKPTQTPTSSPAVAVDSAARAFGNALVTFDGNLGAYESALDKHVTPGLAQSLPQTLHLNARTFSLAASQGHVESLTPVKTTGSAAEVDVIVYQTLAVKGTRPVSRYLLVQLELTQSTGNANNTGSWQVSGMTLPPSSDQLLTQPAQARAKATGRPATGQPTGASTHGAIGG
jgi:hypothetical protein